MHSDPPPPPDANGDCYLTPDWQSLRERLCVADTCVHGAIPVQSPLQAFRDEAVEAAVEWTSQYSSPEVHAPRKPLRIVMSGHQPTLFHPGVWLKNFTIDRMARQATGVAINVIIDSDIGNQRILVPAVDRDRAWWQSIAYGHGSATTPFELQSLDKQAFEEFPEKVRIAVESLPQQQPSSLLIERLWPSVRAREQTWNNAGYCIAAGRHAIEQGLGVQTLEVPISRLCQTRAFAVFLRRIIDDRHKVVDSYNRRLAGFRQRHGISNPNHPLPDLETSSSQVELPFWIYSTGEPIRQRMSVSESRGRLTIPGGPGKLTTDLPAGDLWGFIREKGAAGWLIRPRALMTTLFLRTMLSDLFVHGIGGALYDQITDDIAADLGMEIPRCAVATGTWRMIDESPWAIGQKINLAAQHLRDLNQHPEKFVPPESPAYGLVRQKFELIPQMHRESGRRQRHREMVRINSALRREIIPLAESAGNSMVRMEKDFQRLKILASREVSIVCHPGKLGELLGAAADRLVGQKDVGGNDPR